MFRALQRLWHKYDRLPRNIHSQREDANSSQNITVVGVYRSSTDVNGPYNTLVEHWNGAQWSVVNSPNPGTNYDDLLAVAAVSESSAWAVGYYVDANGHDQTLTEFTC